ncbi:MAG: lipoate--protein ligase family protein [Desulfomonile tiedjei]|nr:lipoate--protein ligase family protein [Desulfomonile tiedjei]
MDLYCLGSVPWQESQLCYHALAHLGREALALVSPATHYVCVGYHQDARKEIAMDFCQGHGIPVFRREVGGGAVYLDGDQLFFQVVLRRDSPLVPMKKEAFYRKFLQPVIDVYRQIGIPAEYKPINDILAGTKKISGTGAGEIGDCVVFVGNLIVDFNYKMMSRVLKVPDEKFRDRVHKTIEANLTTIRRELGAKDANRWSESALNGLVVKEFEKILGPLQPRKVDDILRAKMEALGRVMTTEEWLYRRGRPSNGRNMRIRSGVNLVHKVHKAPGGLIRADFEIREERYSAVALTGDWFCHPRDAIPALESRIEGVSPAELRAVLEEFYNKNQLETPGIALEDWIEVLKA